MTKCVLFLVLFAVLIAAPATARVDPINFGDTLYRRSVCNGSIDSLSFDGNAGDRVVMFVTWCSDYGGNCRPGCCCFDLASEIKDSNGNLVRQNASGLNSNHCSWSLRLALTDIRLANSGKHIITTHDVNYSGGGQFSITLQRTSAPEGQIELLEPGYTWIKSIDGCGTTHTYQFQGVAGDSVTVSMVRYGEGSGVNPRLELYRLDGTLLGKPGNGLIDRVYLPASGLYTVLAYSAYNETGTYQLSLNAKPTPVQPTTWGLLKSRYQ